MDGGLKVDQEVLSVAGFTAMETIHRSPETVFEFLTNPQRTREWVEGFLRLDPITNGEVRIGAQWKETRLLGDKEADAVVEVVTFEGPGKGKTPPYSYAARSVQMGIRTTYHYRVEPEGEGSSLVEMTAIIKANNLITHLLVPIFAGNMKRHDGQQLQFLKKAVEARPDPRLDLSEEASASPVP